MSKELYIKNMVCPRCITAVVRIFSALEIDVKSIKLGEVSLVNKVNPTDKKKLEKYLLKNGFELLEDAKSKMIGQIKSIIIKQIHQSTKELKVNFSILLSENLNQEYTQLSKLFSSVEGVTIERFILKQKIEKVKELLFYNEMTLSEMAYEMGYSSSAHLSTQFKKETGMTPSQFKKIKQPSHRSLDSI